MAIRRSRVVSALTRVPRVGPLVQKAHGVWLGIKRRFFRDFSRNPPAKRMFEGRPSVLSDTQKRIIQGLLFRGVALLAIPDLDVDPDHWNRLRGLGRKFEKAVSQSTVEGSLALAGTPALGHNATRLGRFFAGEGRADDYMVKFLPEKPTLSLEDPLLRFGLDPAVLGIVNGYLGLWSKLIYMDIWHTIRGPDDRRIGSQRWHRDFDDERLVKVYLYLEDAPPETGPLQYVVGSQAGGPRRDLWPWRHAVSHYAPDGELERLVPESEWFLASAPAGSLLFCDTSGLHRGGPTRNGRRLIATWTYVTPASLQERRFNLTRRLPDEGLSEEARWAVS